MHAFAAAFSNTKNEILSGGIGSSLAVTGSPISVGTLPSASSVSSFPFSLIPVPMIPVAFTKENFGFTLSVNTYFRVTFPSTLVLLACALPKSTVVERFAKLINSTVTAPVLLFAVQCA